ncbi:MAG: hypothetical protein P1P90_00610 [Patescibacteria group bacterium]|nr:hypothetical protein [Patescibacteria group bacterium]
MVSEKNRLIIFNTAGQPLGEMIFNHDLFLQATLYPDGEQSLGGCLEDWQVNGIMYFHPAASTRTSLSTIGECVTMHDPAFPSALRQWLERNSLYSVVIPEESWDIWSYIEQLPLSDSEKFNLVMRLSLSEKQNLELSKKSLLKIINELDKLEQEPKPLKKSKEKTASKKQKTKPKKMNAKKVKVKIKK